jgi:hypothetical protein
VILLKSTTRRRGAVAAIAGLLAGVVAIGTATGAVQAAPGTLATMNTCQNNANGNWADIQWTLSGTAAPNPQTLGSGDVTLSGATIVGEIPAAILVAGYNLGVLTTGANAIPTKIWVARSATNVDVGGGVKGTATRVDLLDLPTQLFTTITDPDGVPGGTGPGGADETATPISVSQPLPNWTVTPLGGNVNFSQSTPGAIGPLPIGTGGANVATVGSIFTQSVVAGGLIKVNFDCQPGTTTLAVPPATQNTPVPAASISAFEVGEVVAPPTAPTCTNETVSVGVGQTASVDLRDNCEDVNEAQGGGSPFTFNLGPVSAGTLDPTATAGVYTYTAPATDPGAPVVITFTATDTTGLTSAAGSTISATVLANQCDATAESCDLTQIVAQPVVGTTMSMSKVPGAIVMSPVVLNGSEQVSTGALNTITVTNARGTAAAWSVTAYVTDLGAAGARTFEPLPGVVVPLCSLAGAGPFAANPAFAATIDSDRLCIPGDNLGWTPAAAVAHNDIPGDVAAVTPGAASAASPAAWLAALVAAGNTADPAQGVDGLGGLLGAKTLCSAPVNQSGGTFTCNASLYLGVPASAGAGTYTGGLVLTLA